MEYLKGARVTFNPFGAFESYTEKIKILMKLEGITFKLAADRFPPSRRHFPDELTELISGE